MGENLGESKPEQRRLICRWILQLKSEVAQRQLVTCYEETTVIGWSSGRGSVQCRISLQAVKKASISPAYPMRAETRVFPVARPHSLIWRRVCERLVALLFSDNSTYRADRFCLANRRGEGTALAEQLRSAEGGRRGLFEVPFTRSSERNKFHSRADEKFSVVEPKLLSRAEVVSMLDGLAGRADVWGQRDWIRN